MQPRIEAAEVVQLSYFRTRSLDDRRVSAMDRGSDENENVKHKLQCWRLCTGMRRAQIAPR